MKISFKVFYWLEQLARSCKTWRLIVPVLRILNEMTHMQDTRTEECDTLSKIKISVKRRVIPRDALRNMQFVFV